jgi:hypothetical protein
LPDEDGAPSGIPRPSARSDGFAHARSPEDRQALGRRLGLGPSRENDVGQPADRFDITRQLAEGHDGGDPRFGRVLQRRGDDGGSRGGVAPSGKRRDQGGLGGRIETGQRLNQWGDGVAVLKINHGLEGDRPAGWIVACQGTDDQAGGFVGGAGEERAEGALADGIRHRRVAGYLAIGGRGHLGGLVAGGVETGSEHGRSRRGLRVLQNAEGPGSRDRTEGGGGAHRRGRGRRP